MLGNNYNQHSKISKVLEQNYKILKTGSTQTHSKSKLKLSWVS